MENEIIEQAAKTFAEKGVGASLQDVADALGITRSALYYYVKNKHELLAKLVMDITEGAAAEIRNIADDPLVDAPERLRRIAALIARRRALAPNRFLMMLRSEDSLPPDLTEVNEAAKREILMLLSDVITDGVRAGQFRPVNPRTTALAVAGMCNWVAWWYRPGSSRTPDAVGEEMGELALAMVSQPASRLPVEQGPAGAIAMLREDLDFLEQSLAVPRVQGSAPSGPAGQNG